MNLFRQLLHSCHLIILYSSPFPFTMATWFSVIARVEFVEKIPSSFYSNAICVFPEGLRGVSFDYEGVDCETTVEGWAGKQIPGLPDGFCWRTIEISFYLQDVAVGNSFVFRGTARLPGNSEHGEVKVCVLPVVKLVNINIAI